MPVSIQFQITPCVSKIIGVKPESVLDIGCGYGKWGYLCREYLDAFYGRFRPEDWMVRIDGVEYFEPYIQAHQRALYSDIIIGDIREVVDDLDDYDLIIAGDVIEHMYKEEAEALVEKLYAKARKMLIVNIPIGEGWDHPEQYGNPAELHRSEWYQEDFQGYALEFEDYALPGDLKYAAFFCPKSLPPDHQLVGFLNAADFYLKRDDLSTARRYATRAMAADPSAPEGLCMMVDIQVKQGDVSGAVRTLNVFIEGNRGVGVGQLYLAQLLKAQGQQQESLSLLQEVAALDGVTADIRDQANALLGAWSA